MISYIIEGNGIKEVLDSTEDVLEVISKFKENNPSIDYSVKLNEPKNGNMMWTIKLDIEDGKSEEKVFRKGVKTH